MRIEDARTARITDLLDNLVTHIIGARINHIHAKSMIWTVHVTGDRNFHIGRYTFSLQPSAFSLHLRVERLGEGCQKSFACAVSCQVRHTDIRERGDIQDHTPTAILSGICCEKPVHVTRQIGQKADVDVHKLCDLCNALCSERSKVNIVVWSQLQRC